MELGEEKERFWDLGRIRACLVGEEMGEIDKEEEEEAGEESNSDSIDYPPAAQFDTNKTITAVTVYMYV